MHGLIKQKLKGLVEPILKILFVLVFVNLKNISQLIHSGLGTKLKNGKDVLHDFLKNGWVDWGKILTNFYWQFLKITHRKGDSRDISSPKCLILVDTLLCKTVKSIEKIGK